MMGGKGSGRKPRRGGLHKRERFKLLHGPYRMPKCRIGRKLFCRIRGWVAVAGFSAGRIMWPICRTGKHLRQRSFILCGDLVKAVQVESAQAIGYWWGVGSSTVWTWRKELGVGRFNEGTLRLNRDWMPWRLTEEERARAIAAMNTPEANAKKAAARRGKPRPRELMEALRRFNLGRQLSAQTRAKMSAAHRARGTKPPGYGRPWTPEEDALLGTMPDRDVAARTGRRQSVVRQRRELLGIPRIALRNR